MPHDVRPTTPDDLPELSRFLTTGFHAASDAAFAALDVLRWKYFDPRGADAGDAPRSYLARDPATGQVVGHVGVCPGRFRGPGVRADGVSTLHMIDWLATGAGTGAGATLMRRAHQSAETQYGFGGSAAGRGVIDRGGYGLVAMVPVYRRVLRPSHRLKAPGPPLPGRLLRAAKDAAGRLARPAKPSRVRVELRQVDAFGPEVDPALAALGAVAVHTSRGADLLNHFLRYPRGGLTGWHVLKGGTLRGFAVLAVVPELGGVRTGKLAELVLDDPDDADLWHAAASASTDELARQGADVALGFASTDRTANALRDSGFAPGSPLEFRLRDRSKLIPAGSAFHLTPLEADYAYT
jgi:hypothetical protein